MIVTVGSVHLVERAHSVENLVLNSTNNLILSSRSETTSTKGDGLDSSSSAILAGAFGCLPSVLIQRGETGQKMIKIM